MTQSDYARHRGVTRNAIYNAIKSGRIPAEAVRTVGGRKMIDVERADLAFGENIARIDADDSDKNGFENSPLAGRLTAARTATEVYKARLASLEFNEKMGRVRRVDDIVYSMERCGEAIVREIEVFPSYAEDLAAALAHGGVDGLRKEMKCIAHRGSSPRVGSREIDARSDLAGNRARAAAGARAVGSRGKFPGRRVALSLGRGRNPTRTRRRSPTRSHVVNPAAGSAGTQSALARTGRWNLNGTLKRCSMRSRALRYSSVSR
jgi:hypothetical protein